MRSLVSDPFHVVTGLVGRPLASPGRRFAAFAIDLLVLVVPTVVVGVFAAALSLWASDRAAFDALASLKSRVPASPAERARLMRALTPVLMRLEPVGMPARAVEAYEEGDIDKAAEILGDYNYQLVIRSWLEVESEKALPPKTMKIQVDRAVPPIIRGLTVFGVPALYFTLFTCGRRGATIGKRLLGIRVVRLDGEHLSWLEGLERFVGYVHLPATFFVSLADLWRDANRRLPHDRVVHTAVVMARVAPAPAVAPPIEAAPGASAPPPSPPAPARHSHRNATTGSTFVTRRAGT